jgi:hypothetical protein
VTLGLLEPWQEKAASKACNPYVRAWWCDDTKKVNMFLYFWISLIRAIKSVGKVFLMIKIRPEFMGALVYSLIKLWWH